jgi:nucleoside-diphosphate-sugar epimerase
MLKHINQSPVAPKRVVILGGSGFVGKTLVNHFSKQAMDVLSVGSDQLDLDSDSSVTKLQGLLQPEDCLIILSALTPDRGRGIDTLMTNLRMIENVSSVLFEHNVAQVIYCSSDAVYPMDFPIVDEATPAAPSDLYGVMHRTREIMLQSTVKSPLCIIRPTLIYGADDSHNSYGPNRFRRQAETEQKINLGGEGEETRDHVYVEDLVSLIGLLVSHKSEGVVNIATGQSYSFMEIAKQVASLFDVPVEICTSARQSVITHRQFDVACIKDSFPEFSFKDFASGSKLAHVK